MLSIITEIRIFIGWLVGNTPGELFNYISVLNLVKISPIVSDVERDSDRNNNESPPPHRIKTNTTNNLVTNTTQLFFSLSLSTRTRSKITSYPCVACHFISISKQGYFTC